MTGLCSHCRVLGDSMVENNCREFGKHMELHEKQIRLTSALVQLTDNEPSVEENLSSRTSHQIISQACYDILRDKKTDGRRVCCEKCGQLVIIFTTAGSFRSIDAIDHARSHLGKILFDCPHCDRGYQTINSIRQHVKRMHGRAYPGKKCQQEKSADSTMAVLDMVKECFGNNDDDKETEGTKLSSVQRLLERKRRVIDILQNHYGNVCCKICGKETRLKPRRIVSNWNCPMDHVRIHLDKPVFQCKLCGRDAHTYCTIQKHIRQKHRVSSQGQYEDHSDEFHHELMQMISKCYGHA